MYKKWPNGFADLEYLRCRLKWIIVCGHLVNIDIGEYAKYWRILKIFVLWERIWGMEYAPTSRYKNDIWTFHWEVPFHAEKTNSMVNAKASGASELHFECKRSINFCYISSHAASYSFSEYDDKNKPWKIRHAASILLSLSFHWLTYQAIEIIFFKSQILFLIFDAFEFVAITFRDRVQWMKCEKCQTQKWHFVDNVFIFV